MGRLASYFFSLNQTINRFFGPLLLLLVGLGFLVRLNHLSQPQRYIFDEDYHAFTANQAIGNFGIMFEWWHQPFPQSSSRFDYRQPAVEWLHPPLAKYIWITSIKLLGNQPLGWRLPSVIFGTINIALVIWLTLILTNNRGLSLLAGLLLATEKLSIAQSQIAMNDIFLTTWIMLAIIFYLLNRTNKRRIIWVAPLCLGLAAATKWTGFWIWPVFSLDYLINRSLNQGCLNSRFTHLKLITLNLLKTLVLFFLVPLFIYCLSYAPMVFAGKTASDFIKLHQEIIHYQTHIQFNHPNQSQPWQWAFGQKPVYYALKSQGDKVNRVAQTQPLFVIITTLALLASLGLFLLFFTHFLVHQKQKSIVIVKKTYVLKLKNLFFITALILSLWLPWFFISRPKFIYYFTPIVPLLIVNSATLINIYFVTNRKFKPC